MVLIPGDIQRRHSLCRVMRPLIMRLYPVAPPGFDWALSFLLLLSPTIPRSLRFAPTVTVDPGWPAFMEYLLVLLVPPCYLPPRDRGPGVFSLDAFISSAMVFVSPLWYEFLFSRVLSRLPHLHFQRCTKKDLSLIPC